MSNTMNDEVRRAIGMRLKQSRLAARLTQKYVAATLQLKARQTVSAWERGETMPSTEQWYELAPLLGQSLDYLVYNVRTTPVSTSDVMGSIFRVPRSQARPMYAKPERIA